jgi:preprotein translocase subunit SecE
MSRRRNGARFLPGTVWAAAGNDPRQKEGIVTETSAKRGSERAGEAQGGNAVSRFFGAIALFIRQILDELRKVVRPTGPELIRYTTVVVVFVMIMMAIVSGLDLGFSKLISWAFTGEIN